MSKLLDFIFFTSLQCSDVAVGCPASLDFSVELFGLNAECCSLRNDEVEETNQVAKFFSGEQLYILH
uniref:Putative secreted protein n=1 Tax=Ixodes ricinus TaxID=34613 RepID=A0A6B0TZV9_IXORI